MAHVEAAIFQMHLLAIGGGNLNARRWSDSVHEGNAFLAFLNGLLDFFITIDKAER